MNNHQHIVSETPYRIYSVDVDTLTDRNAATASVTFHTRSKGSIHATGSAKRNSGDVYNDVSGEQLAVGRALMHLGKYLADKAIGDDHA